MTPVIPDCNCSLLRMFVILAGFERKLAGFRQPMSFATRQTNSQTACDEGQVSGLILHTHPPKWGLGQVGPFSTAKLRITFD